MTVPQEKTNPVRHRRTFTTIAIPLVWVTFFNSNACALAQQSTQNAQLSGKIQVNADAPDSTSEIAFAPMTIDQIESQLLQWLAARRFPEAIAQKVTQTWATESASDQLSAERLLDAMIVSFAAADEDARKLLDQCRQQGVPDAIETSGQPEFFASHLQLYRARWLVQHRFYDDALTSLDQLKPDRVVDPGSLFFYRAICQSELLKTKEALETLSLLQNNTLEVPERFSVVAEMLKQELLAREEDGMKQVAELMTDVERRLDLGRSGEKTQAQEEAVIAALDKLLEDLENQKKKQQEQNQQGGGGQGQQQQNTTPASQSQIKNGISANGEADAKNLKETGQWGLLNNKQEAEAREMIQQKFPPNFLDQIGRYTRKIAEQKK